MRLNKYHNIRYPLHWLCHSLFALVLQHLDPILERHRAEVFAVPLPAARTARVAAATVAVGLLPGRVAAAAVGRRSRQVEEALHVVAGGLGVGGQACEEGRDFQKGGSHIGCLHAWERGSKNP